MVQACIYDYLDNDTDPILVKIKSLDPGHEACIGSGITVGRNAFNMYEIKTNETHDPARNIQLCYKKVLKIIDDLSRE